MPEEKKYSEKPTLCKELVYEDSEVKLTKIWTWNIRNFYKEDDAGVFVATLNKNGKEKYIFVSEDGKQLTDLEFDEIWDYEDDMLKVYIKGQGYGFLNKNLEITIPLKYERAREFENGYACVYDGKQWLYVDKKGKEIRLKKSYERIENFSDGMVRVSTMALKFGDLAYHSDYDDDAGKWGYTDLTGKEIIKPQYIYAFDFINDRAIVVKGEWTKDKKWDNEYNQNCYWTEEELWGVIDKNGNEIIPCIYDEIREFMNDDFSFCEDYYQVHVGGWKEGKWAVIDRNGKFVTEPIFEDVSYDYCNGLLTVRESDSWDDVPLGIYDLNENKFLFEPQFDDVRFLDNGNILVEVFDKELGYKIEKIIDKTGNEVFKSAYTSIDTSKTPWQAIKETENSCSYNLIDEQGNILDSNEFQEKPTAPDWYNPINFDTRIYIYKENDKFGLKKFNGEIIVPAQYEKIHNFKNDGHLYYFEEVKYSGKKGLMKSDGTILIQPDCEYIDVLKNNKIICNGKNGTEVYMYELKQEENKCL